MKDEDRTGEQPADITARKRAEREIASSQAQYRDIFNAASDGLFIVEPGDRIVDANPRMCKMFGYTYDEMLQLGGIDLAPPEVHQHFKEVRLQVQKTGAFFIETIGLRKDGSTFDVEVKGAGFSYGGKQQMLGIFRDITKQKKYEASLKSREEELLKKSQDLEEVNAALKVLLQRRDEDRKETQETLMINFKELVLPYLESIKETRLTQKQKGCLEMLEANLKNIVSPFLKNLKIKFHDLTPAEIKVVNLIKEGKRTKEIAEILGLSKRTVDFYRYNIRKKLLLTEKTSLMSHLSSL